MAGLVIFTYPWRGMFRHLKVAVVGATVVILCATSIAASSSGEPNPPKRTIVASGPITPDPLASLERAQGFQEYIFALEMQSLVQYVQAQEQAEYLASIPPPVTETPVYVQPTATSPVTSNPGDFLSCVRNRESGGNYGIYNSGGSGAAGAYQFLPGTWNNVAASTGRGDLVGVSPAQASPADQDAMAQALYAQQGMAPWGGGC